MKQSTHKRDNWLKDRQFTDDEMERLRGILRKFPEENVETFMGELEVFCVLEKIYRKRRGDVTDNRADRRRILRRIEKLRADLLLIVDQKLQTQADKSLLGVGIFSGLIPSTSSDMARAAAAVVLEEQRRYYVILNTTTALKEIATFIDADRNEPGRPQADNAAGDLVTLIARSFQFHFKKKPTSYAGAGTRGGGAFLDVVELMLTKCGIGAKDHSQHIRQALKNL